jgi:hypothetical protein
VFRHLLNHAPEVDVDGFIVAPRMHEDLILQVEKLTMQTFGLLFKELLPAQYLIETLLELFCLVLLLLTALASRCPVALEVLLALMSLIPPEAVVSR